MARVSDGCRTGPEGGSASSPLGREGAAGGLSKLMRSAGGMEGLSVPFIISKSKSAFLGSMSGVSKSYVSDADIRRLFNGNASRFTGTGLEGIGVTGKGEGMPETREPGFTASRSSETPWITAGELVVATLAVGVVLSTV